MRIVLPLRTFSTNFVLLGSRLVERTVRVTLPLLLERVTDLRWPAWRPVTNSVAAVLAGVSRVIVQVTAFLEAVSLQAVLTVRVCAGTGVAPLVRVPVPGVLGSGVVVVIGAAETVSASDVASPVPAEFSASSWQATSRPRSAAVSV